MLSLNEASGSSRRLKVCEGNLALLKEKLGADPLSYEAEFGEQFEHFQRHLKLLELQPAVHRSSIDAILQLSDFLSATARHYPEKAAQFGELTMRVLGGAQVSRMDPELRLALCKCVVGLTLARVVDLSRTVQLLFALLRCEDKQMRKFILGSLIAFIRRCTPNKGNNAKWKKGGGGGKRKKHKCGRMALQQGARLQQTLFAMLNDSNGVCARVAQLALVEAYKRHYWRDAKTANALAQCVFHRVQRIQVSTMRFFLGPSHGDEDGDEESSDEDEEGGGKQDNRTLKEVMQQFRHAKKTKKRQKQMEQAKKAIGGEKKRGREKGGRHCNLEAVRAIHDPQRFADRLFSALDGKRNEKYAIRLLQIALCARVIGVHRLQTLGFYSYLHRYLQPKQKEVTRVLLYAAQACHELVPPDLVEQLVRVVAQNFVSDRNTPEAITVGLNTIREIYANCPAAATEDMVRDLAEYKKMHNKNVSMAARALITLIRAQNIKLLHHKDRGRPTGEERSEIAEFGRIKALDHVPGAEILPEDVEEAERLAQMVNSSEDEENEGEEDEEGMEVDEGKDEEEAEVTMEEDEGGEDGWMTVSEEEEEEEEIGSDEEDDDEEWDEAEEDMDEDDEESGREEAEEGEAVKKRTMMKGAQKMAKKTAKRAQTEEERRAQLTRAQQISAGRILSDADFRLIRIRKLREAARMEERKGGKRKTNDEARLEEQQQEKRARAETSDGLVRLQDIEHFHRKIRRQTKEERMEQVRQGRPGKEAYGKPKKGAHVGRTNRELAKRKPAQMVRQKVRGRNRQRSFRDRQQTLRKFLLRQQGKKA